jgi:hypothetical protein
MQNEVPTINKATRHCAITYSLPSEDVFLNTRRWVWRTTPCFLHPRLWRLFLFLDALRLEVPAFLGRMRILLAEKFWSVELGHPLVELRNGRLVRSNRTAARSHGIRQLRSRYPWASLVEHESFLAGFDAGEAFALGNQTCIPVSEVLDLGASDFPFRQPVDTDSQSPPDCIRQKGEHDSI